MSPLTQKEKRAIQSLKMLASTWPKSLWLFSASGALCVMKCNEKGERAYEEYRDRNSGGGVDQKYFVDSINIPNDGGDW